MLFSSLCIFWKKLSLILCLNELTLLVDLNPMIGYSIFLAPNRTDTFGQCYFCEMEG